MSAPTKAKRRIRYARSTDPMDMRRAVEVLAREHEDRLAGPRARGCRCSKPWPLEEGRCVRCGREVRPA